jgi:hypothetical protein
MSGQTMTNIMIHEWVPRVYLSIVGVAIPTMTHITTLRHITGYALRPTLLSLGYEVMFIDLVTYILYPSS